MRKATLSAVILGVALSLYLLVIGTSGVLDAVEVDKDLKLLGK
jgi:hypothetical protein